MVSELETHLFRSVSAVLSQSVSDGNSPGAKSLPRWNTCSEDLTCCCVPLHVLLFSFACLLSLLNRVCPSRHIEGLFVLFFVFLSKSIYNLKLEKASSTKFVGRHKD